MRTAILLFLALLLWMPNVEGQALLTKHDSIKVFKNGKRLWSAWAGGLNHPQFSSMDLNSDGFKDLVLFDRTGSGTVNTGKLLTFINCGIADSTCYIHDAYYQQFFPSVHDWFLLRDFNCDGKQDIFTQNQGDISVYRNTSIAGLIGFSLETSKIISNYDPNVIPLYVSSVDIPSIEDMDGDGDLDILTFTIAGNYIEYHQNFSKELYGSCDSLEFKLTEECWGSFSENSANNTIVLNQPCPRSLSNVVDAVHSGSCLLCHDLDDDGDKDVVIGDISYPNINVVYMDGNGPSSLGIQNDPSYPSNDLPVNIPIYPCPYAVDINNNTSKELIFSPNAFKVSNTHQGIWLYEKSGSEYILRSKQFLQDQMIETGEGAAPILFDYNADGLEDLLVANYGYFVSSSTFVSKITAYKNTGTSNAPEFTFDTDDWQNLSQYSMLALHPSFGDIDGDGDKDMIMGVFDGFLNLFTNTAGNGNPSVFSAPVQLKNSKGRTIDLGLFSTPFLFDVNGDDLMDIISGNRNGKFAYFHNSGSQSAPIFDSISYNWGKVSVTIPGYTEGYSKPFLWRQGSGLQLYSGSDRGTIFRYDNIDWNINGTFNKQDTAVAGIYEGLRSAPYFSDIDNDGTLDLFIGNYRGGISFYKGSAPFNVESKAATDLKIFPNPAQTLIYTNVASGSTIIIFDVTGRILLKESIDSNHPVDISSIKNGVYIWTIINKSQSRQTGKLVIKH